METVSEFEAKSAAKEKFILPIAVMIETGNHIAHVTDGGARRVVAERFVEFVGKALDGDLPFSPAPMPEAPAIRGWLSAFVDDATRGVGLADRSIIAVWETQKAFHARSGRVYIWSSDHHLVAYDTGA